MPASQPACVLVRDQVSMNCGRSAGTVENPARPRISATHTAATIAAEGAEGVEVAELTVYLFRLWAYGVTLPSSHSRISGEDRFRVMDGRRVLRARSRLTGRKFRAGPRGCSLVRSRRLLPAALGCDRRNIPWSKACHP